VTEISAVTTYKLFISDTLTYIFFTLLKNDHCLGGFQADILDVLGAGNHKYESNTNLESCSPSNSMYILNEL